VTRVAPEWLANSLMSSNLLDIMNEPLLLTTRAHVDLMRVASASCR
jgi:hypothetical protein